MWGTFILAGNSLRPCASGVVQPGRGMCSMVVSILFPVYIHLAMFK